MNAENTAEVKTKKNFTKYISRYGVYIIFLAAVIFFAVNNGNFFTLDNLLMILQQASPLAICGIGMTLVLILAGTDISAGQTMFFGATVAAMVSQALIAGGFPADNGFLLVICLLCGVVVGAFVGAINGILVGRFNIIPFIATLATQNIMRGLALICSNSQTINVPELATQINVKLFGFFPMVILIALVLLVIFSIILRRYPYGRRLMAIGKDKMSAAKIGINVVSNTFVAYLICGIMAGICGVILGAQTGGVPISLATGNEFIVISGCVLGGTSLFGGRGSIIPGAVVGIVMVQMVLNGLAMVNASPYIYIIVRGAIIFLAVMMDSINFKGELR